MALLNLVRNFVLPAALSNVQRCLSSAAKTVRVHFISSEGTHDAEGRVGDTLLDVVDNSDIPLDGFGACGGALACCSCHVILEKRHFDRLPPAGEEELDMLDLSPAIDEFSRLGCQVKLTEADLPEIRVNVPSVIVDARTMD